MSLKYNIAAVLILFTLLIYKGTFINIMSYLNLITHKETNVNESEIKILKNNIKTLEYNLKELGDNISNKKTNYSLTRLSYKDLYDPNIFYIYGGKNNNYKENDLLVNNLGLVGIIESVYENYSKCKTLKSIKNLSIVINDTYTNISSYEDGYFIVKNISNYDEVLLNDKVYTAPNTYIKDKTYIGYIYKIDESDIYKTLYIKSEVNFNEITYLHVIGE